MIDQYGKEIAVSTIKYSNDVNTFKCQQNKPSYQFLKKLESTPTEKQEVKKMTF